MEKRIKRIKRTRLGMELEAALKEALAYARGEPNNCTVHPGDLHGAGAGASPIKLSKEKATKPARRKSR